MKHNVIANFAVIRFLPYPETEEFVNIGVVLACPQTGLFDFRIETKRYDRITHFFPEMDKTLFIEGRHAFLEEMRRVRDGLAREERPAQQSFDFREQDFVRLFQEIVKPRESLFRFSEVGTVMAADAQAELTRLFDHYVERQFATHEEYQETIMTRRLTKTFKAREIMRYYHKKRFGDEIYGVTFPFVHDVDERIEKAIKPLDLNKQDTTRIIEYGDKWRMRVQRLNAMNSFPKDMLFVVRQPAQGKRHDAAVEIRQELEGLGTQTLNEKDRDAVIEFAKAV